MPNVHEFDDGSRGVLVRGPDGLLVKLPEPRD
jgi:hypothetical protein